MSDNRQDAQRELHTQVETNIEDSLGSALESSFNIPPPAPKPKVPVPSQEKESAPAATASAPVPGLDEWPQTLQGYLDEWQAESATARAKAEATRKRFEEERAAEAKALEDAKKAEKTNKEEEEKRKRDAERLRQELEGEEDEVQGGKGHGHGDKSRVKEAWELVAKKEGQSKDTPVVETDVRGVTGEDVFAGQAGEKKEVKAPAYDPTTSTDPIPPIFQDPKPVAPAPAPTESATLSRHSATSQAWEEISGQSSGSGEQVSPPRSSGSDDIVQVPSNPEKAPEAPRPPTQPPSLTLTLFTNASSLSIPRIFAVIGINLVLPFINGVMLGFGEIFAREVVKVGKAVWRGERSLFNWNRGSGLGGRGTTGVGLSGAGF
ncbi:hypothetical protein CNBH3770 [Cryptococcus deneoformans B-3501A]|uniref:Expressed protein n=1 Tax=Cryptococcus deneoformans (strain JEC21 / ATCC MYA-565) TaxID=214684 RepID=Q5KB32_CRYD1|nr:expressed protein [Cryptococcus neoformans var. neoformans JEC21]XP_773925.1 hypothetical protein CNBH3770 [Cryptococcus neoformans var. neoformans B-3501A]AAW45642.1 expressed protein [Cryptococcus neoformans var. neoformans JEC21]EAL19278.1 hypothetical protein CNBH3770 [Cryptococcus neoformans var. neoformans B-3501A]